MKPHHTRSRFVILALALLIALPSLADKKRAVKHPSIGTPLTATIKGTALDAATNAVIPFVSISVGERHTTTTREGTFELTNVPGNGSLTVTASRAGYVNATQTITTSGTHTLTFRLQAKPTVTLKLANGTTVPIADGSVKLGYVILFGGYVSSAEDEFCRPDGSRSTITVAAMKRIVGPATMATVTPCCTRPVQKVRLELRSGDAGDVTFKDSCDGYSVDFIGMHQTTGDNVFASFNDVAEVIFP